MLLSNMLNPLYYGMKPIVNSKSINGSVIYDYIPVTAYGALNSSGVFYSRGVDIFDVF